MDIEGSELAALRGMVHTISNYQPVFLVEVSESVLKEESDRQQVFKFFETFNYDKFIISEGGDLIKHHEVNSISNTNYIFKPSLENSKTINGFN